MARAASTIRIIKLSTALRLTPATQPDAGRQYRHREGDKQRDPTARHQAPQLVVSDRVRAKQVFEARRLVGYLNVGCDLIGVIEDRPEETEEQESSNDYEPGEGEAILEKDNQGGLPQRCTPDAALGRNDLGWCDARCSLPAGPLIADH
jgi:hypothetical protein